MTWGYARCRTCNETMRIRAGCSWDLETHLEEKHPESFELKKKANAEYETKQEFLRTQYPERGIAHWFFSVEKSPELVKKFTERTESIQDMVIEAIVGKLVEN